MLPKVVVIDDEELILNILASYLKKEYEVLKFISPQEALAKAPWSEVKAVVCDFYMPEMTGQEFSKALNQQNNVPVILMSGSHVQDHEKEGFKACIKKPFKPQEIQALVKKVIE